MEKDNRWSEARDALSGVAEHAVKYGSTEIDMRFLNSSIQCQDIKVRGVPRDSSRLLYRP